MSKPIPANDGFTLLFVKDGLCDARVKYIKEKAAKQKTGMAL
ncbi:MAG: hypothetical protein P8H28_03880 [Porticoccaceae bacterium]|jgi:hypothetical protein|nr:hypothetical protein [Porticoccaceae bacterium]